MALGFFRNRPIKIFGKSDNFRDEKDEGVDVRKEGRLLKMFRNKNWYMEGGEGGILLY